jgi:Uma2 family endonuclease
MALSTESDFRDFAMTTMIRDAELLPEARVIRLTERPISFEHFLEIAGEDSDLELVNGVLVERMSAQLDHERLYLWLVFLLNGFVVRRGLGLVLGSRSAVEINEFGGRLPDMLFVSSERMEIVRQRAIYGAPDLVIEIRSANDRPSDVLALEADYRSIGVQEIVFIDPMQRRVLVLRKQNGAYQDELLTTDELQLTTVPGFHLDVDCLFATERPNEFDILVALLGE